MKMCYYVVILKISIPLLYEGGNMTCTFFGSRDTNINKIEVPLLKTLVNLIENDKVDTFYVGNQGNFDYAVQKQLNKLQKFYPHIKYSIALAYLPKEKSDFHKIDFSNSFLPEGVEKGPIKFAIDRRNRWLINNSDYVVTCVHSPIGGAAKYKALAEKKGKIVIDICS